MTEHSSLRSLGILHILNDGFYASLFLFLPFLTDEFGMSLTQAGLLGTVVNSIGIFCALPAGYLTTRIGGIRLLILSVILYGIGYIGTGLASTYPWLFPMFVIAGIGFGFFHPVAFGLVTRISTAGNRGKNMGNFTAVGDVGKIGISSLLTFIVVAIGWRQTAMIYGGVAITIALVFVVFLEKQHHIVEKSTGQNALVGMWDIFVHPRFFLAMLTSFLDVFSGASLFVFLPFLLLARGIDAAFLGTFSAVFFLGNLFGKSVLGRFADRFKSAKVIIASELCMAVCIVALALSTSIVVIVFCSVILGMFTKGTVPVIQTMVAESSDHHGQFEKSFAVSGLIGSIALTIAPVALGVIADQWGIVAAFYAMAVTAALAIIPAFFFQYSQTQLLHTGS